MVMKKLSILFVIVLAGLMVYTQEWQKTVSDPEGAGVTEIVIHPDNGYIFVTTASYNWPSGADGGIRRSTNGGNSWENSLDCYTGRTIALCADGNLYASCWPYPNNETLYRSTDNGDTWNGLYSVSFVDNIFAIAVNPTTTPNTIFIGTGHSIQRSVDDGASFQWLVNGLPTETFVRTLEVDSSGTVAAGTTDGLYISYDNGDNWQLATGDGIENDTIVRVAFDYPLNSKDQSRIIAGSAGGKIYVNPANTTYLELVLRYAFAPNKEISNLGIAIISAFNYKSFKASTYPNGNSPGGTHTTTNNDLTTFEEDNEGLPGPLRPVSAMSVVSSQQTQTVHMGCGIFNSLELIAQVFTKSYAVSLGSEEYPVDQLKNNTIDCYPNPITENTTVTFYLKSNSKASLVIYSYNGEEIQCLDLGFKKAGEHTVHFDGNQLTKGIYFCNLKTNAGTVATKIIKN